MLALIIGTLGPLNFTQVKILVMDEHSSLFHWSINDEVREYFYVLVGCKP